MPPWKQQKRNGFMLFTRCMQDDWRRRGDNMSPQEALTRANHFWQSLSDDEKQEWRDKAKEERGSARKTRSSPNPRELPRLRTRNNMAAALIEFVFEPLRMSSYFADTSSDASAETQLKAANELAGRTFCADQLSAQIWRHFIVNRQQNELFERKLSLRDLLYKIIYNMFPRCGLYIVGSSMNGFGTKSSDLDICLMLTQHEIDQRTEAVELLTVVSKAMAACDLVRTRQLILAKVPILRLRFNGPFSDIEVDLNVNNSVAIKNTHLLFYYSSWDWRVCPLALIVKEWAKARGIKDAAQSTLSSYSLILMLIHYLQYGCQTPVLPSLHELYPMKFHPRIDIRCLSTRDQLPPPPPQIFKSENSQDLGPLFVGFLEYFGTKFNYETDAISVRLGKTVERGQAAGRPSPFNHPAMWRCICIEEPFTLANTAHSVYDERIFERVKQEFVDSWTALQRHNDAGPLLQGPETSDVASASPAP